METTIECPYCGVDLTNKWIQYRVEWDGETLDQSSVCPECDQDMTEDEDWEL